MRVLLALGGNAMTNADGRARPEDQIEAAEVAMESVADLIAEGHDVVITHGNGPQVGNLLVKNELAAAVVPPVPLDWCGAQTQATLGFVLMDALDAALARRGIERRCATVVTRTLVDRNDPGFSHPTKPIGRFLPREEAEFLVNHGETWEDRGAKGWRRVVASPEPIDIVDAPAVLALMDAGFVVDRAGNGEEAIARVLGRAYDLIICDLKMPRVDGMQFYRMLERDHPAAARRILFVTGDVAGTDAERFLEETGCRWLAKPFRLRDLLRTAQEILRP